jgi:D-alanyl-D-alanine carboxypeptidase/D-alanyl-D-alanine-endopeptidase (penicillin-binding protein 4)
LDLKAVVFADRIRVWGVIPADVRSWEGRYAHPDPVALFGSVLEHALREGGVLVSGVRRRERDAPGAHVLACLRSSIVSVLGPINTHSNNAVADQLFYKLGADVGGGGDRSGGARATLAAMAELGLDSAGFCQVDGSGLSRENRITARQMVLLIDAVIAPDDDGARAFMGSLALSGRTGTLEDRMRGTAAEGRVRAKSGFIGGTSALSGVVLCEGARLLVFSILVEYPVVSGLNTDVWKPMQDSICEALARSG